MLSSLSRRTPRFRTQFIGFTWTPHTCIVDLFGGSCWRKCLDPNQINSVLSGLSCSLLALHHTWIDATHSSISCRPGVYCSLKSYVPAVGVVGVEMMSYRERGDSFFKFFGVTDEFYRAGNGSLRYSLFDLNRCRYLCSDTIELSALFQVRIKPAQSCIVHCKPIFHDIYENLVINLVPPIALFL